MHKLILVAAMVTLGAAAGAPSGRASGASPGDVPKSWAPADSADSLWRQGRNAISDEDWRAAQRLFALSQKSDDRAQQALRDYASREDLSAHLREQAIFWLGQRRSEDNAKFLRDLFAKTTGPEAKDKILFSISQSRSAGNDQWLLDQAVNAKNSMELRKQALFWAGQNGSIDIAKNEKNRELRKQAIFWLGQSRDPRAIKALQELINR